MSSSGGNGGMVLQATTGVNGFALQNGTPTIISWTAPNDGNSHRATIYALLIVTVTEVGGAIQITTTGGVNDRLFNDGNSPGQYINASVITDTFVPPNTAYSIVQGSALTSGAAKLYAEIWGS